METGEESNSEATRVLEKCESKVLREVTAGEATEGREALQGKVGSEGKTLPISAMGP